MKEYTLVTGLLEMLAEYFYESWEESRMNLRIAFQNNPSYKESLGIELKQAINDTKLNWVHLARESSYVFYKPSSTAQDIISSLQLFVWDYLFPEEVLHEEEISYFRMDIVNLLKTNGDMSTEELIETLQEKGWTKTFEMLVDVEKFLNRT